MLVAMWGRIKAEQWFELNANISVLIFITYDVYHINQLRLASMLRFANYN